MSVTILQGDCLEVLRTLPDESVHCCVTSPPYWGLRDYGVAGQIGLEPTPQEYVAKMVEVFAEVRRVLRGDGTCWLNLGDSYSVGKPKVISSNGYDDPGWTNDQSRKPPPGLKPKDLCGIPWHVAFALQADGWYLRSDIIWHKPNPMPESVTDRPTKSHEYIFLLTKSERYAYDAEAIKEQVAEGTEERYAYAFGGAKSEALIEANKTGVGQRTRVSGMRTLTNGKHSTTQPQAAGRRIVENVAAARISGANHDNPFGPTRNRRSVWTVPTSPYSEAHFATFPPDLIKPCILAGCPVGGTVLDPFGGSGTTGMVSLELGRKSILIELNPEYVQLAEQRTNVTPGFAL